MDFDFDFGFDFGFDFDGDGDFDAGDEEEAEEKFDPEEIEVMIVTEGDDLVCLECEEWDGVIVTLGEAFEILPIHPNCRCTIEYADDDDEAKLKWFEDALNALGNAGYAAHGFLGQAASMLVGGIILFPFALFTYGIKDSLSPGKRSGSKRKRRR